MAIVGRKNSILTGSDLSLNQAQGAAALCYAQLKAERKQKANKRKCRVKLNSGGNVESVHFLLFYTVDPNYMVLFPLCASIYVTLACFLSRARYNKVNKHQ